MNRQGVRRATWVGAVVAVVGLAGWSWLAAEDAPANHLSQTSGAEPPDMATGLTTFDAGKRRAVPAIRGTTLDGRTYSVNDDRGHVVVVNVWASWCRPCRTETPELVRLANRYRSRNVRFIGLDTRDDSTAALAFTRKHAVPYPSIVDNGDIIVGLRDLIPTAAVPSTVVIDKDGAVAARIIGRATYPVLQRVLDRELSRAEMASGAGS